MISTVALCVEIFHGSVVLGATGALEGLVRAIVIERAVGHGTRN
jgi:hypothetical protein